MRIGSVGNCAGSRTATPIIFLCTFLSALSALPASAEQAGADSGIRDLLAAESFIDAFYTWDAEALADLVQSAPADAPQALYYQAWAEAGHYSIQTRRPCAPAESGTVTCAITVTDDIGTALGYMATDTFHFTVSAGEIVGIEFTSDDPPVLEAVITWMAEDRPEVLDGPCKDMFAGGTTPAACVRAVVQGARDYRSL